MSSAPPVPPVVYDQPGLYTMPAALYHADPCPTPSLSATLVKRICLASPAHARAAHPRLTPDPVTEVGEHLDLGTAAHALLLEGTTAVEVIDAKDWRTKAAQEARAAARAAGKQPLLARVWGDVHAMVHALRGQLAAHEDGAAQMFTDGAAEQTLLWQEGDTWCRARLDWLRVGAVDDYKTTSTSANPDAWTRSLFYQGLDIQVAWYLRGLYTLTGQLATFRFAVQETYKPFALAVVALGPDALMLAEKKIRYALEVWDASSRRGAWPGYPARTCYAALPQAHEAWWLEKELQG